MEEPIFTIRPSIKPIIFFYIVCFLISALFISLAISSESDFFLFLAPLSFLGPITIHIGRQYTIYTLTNENIKIRTGIIGKTQTMIPLAKVQNVTFSYTVTQRMLGIGKVLIESASPAGAISFDGIEKPEACARQILDGVKSYQRNNSQP